MEKETLCKVLIVDDEYIIRQGIEYLLDWEKEGFSLVGEASNGEEALQKIAKLHPNIVLSDIVMPKIDGIDLTKRIQELYPDIRVIILSSYSDFDYVKNTFQHGAVDYILKPTLNPADLLKALKKVAGTIPELTLQNTQNLNIGRMLSKYILGFDVKLEELDVKEQFLNDHYRLLATSKKFYQDTNQIQDFFQKSLYQELKDLHPCIFHLQDDILCCLFNGDEINIKEILKRLLEESRISPVALFALSSEFDQLSEIKKIYHDEIWTILRQRFYVKGQHLICYHDLPVKTQIDQFDVRLFNSNLDAMNVYLAMDQLKNYVINAIDHYVSEGELKSQVGSALYNLISVFENHHMNMDSVRHFKLNCMNLLESAVYKEEFLEQLEQIYQDFEVIVEQYELDNSNDPMNQILNYIKAHFDEPLSLNDLAEHFGFSYHYLSSFFAQRSDGTFTEHLNQVRIEKACELLNNKAHTIAEVGALAGYSDHSYFCRVFKKLTGMTPSEFRKRNIG